MWPAPSVFSLPRERVARDAAAHVLVADVLHGQCAAAALGDALHGELLEHVVFHIGQELAVVLALVVMRVDVDDQHVVELALHRLLAGVRQQPAGVQLLDGYASAAIRNKVHGVFS